jgi:putative flippase GtrA
MKKENRFMAWWMGIWQPFSEKHPKAAKLLAQLFYFYVFSLSVTIFQYLMFTILPYVFGIGLAGTEFMWPQIPMKVAGYSYKWNILGYDIARNAAGEVIIGGGLGYFLSYEIGAFLAQCINFPLQRNITFKSHGKLSWQIMWYVIAWILISLFCNGINGLWLPIAQQHFSPGVYNLLVTFITGGVSMVIYFFVYKIIFPEGEADKRNA